MCVSIKTWPKKYGREKKSYQGRQRGTRREGQGAEKEKGLRDARASGEDVPGHGICATAGAAESAAIIHRLGLCKFCKSAHLSPSPFSPILLLLLDYSTVNTVQL